jgi:hypothetical protein
MALPPVRYRSDQRSCFIIDCLAWHQALIRSLWHDILENQLDYSRCPRGENIPGYFFLNLHRQGSTQRPHWLCSTNVISTSLAKNPNLYVIKGSSSVLTILHGQKKQILA